MTQKDFVILSKIGEGTFGQVYKVNRLVDNQQYAMKKVKFTDLKDKDKKNTLNQIRILASINHPNIVQYKEAFLDEKNYHLCIVMELAPGGDLSQMIKTKFKSGEGFFQYEIWKYGYNILAGLKHLHDLNIIHRDLKPANLFFGKNGIIKIGDLNVAKRLITDFTKTQTGTPNYASPQIWNTQPYSFQCDIWSFGCILYEMCTFRSPFKSKNMDQLYQKVQNCVYDQIPKRYSSVLQDVISKCLTKKRQRIKIQQLIKIFGKYTSNSEKQNDVRIDSLLQTITFQNHKANFSLLLPDPKYQKNLQSPEKSNKVHKSERRLFQNYTKESSLKNIDKIQMKVKNYEQVKVSKSERVLPLNKYFSYLDKKSSIERNISFKQILNSISQIQEKLMMKRKPLERMNIHRRNLRINLKL